MEVKKNGDKKIRDNQIFFCWKNGKELHKRTKKQRNKETNKEE